MLGKRNRKINNDDVDLDMVPIMNMFLVLIPFLLMSVSFLNLKAINTSIPLLAESGSSDSIKQLEPKLTVIIEIREKGLFVSAISDSVGEKVLDNLRREIAKGKKNKYYFNQLAAYLINIKKSYPASDTVIIIPDANIKYEIIIHAMDTVRYSKENPLFPKVVLSGKVG